MKPLKILLFLAVMFGFAVFLIMFGRAGVSKPAQSNTATSSATLEAGESAKIDK